MSANSTGPAPRAIHATALAFRETGILIRGRSGSGKSSLALALLALARERHCYGGLIGDDRVILEAHSGRLVARCAAKIEGLIERRGIGILQATGPRAAVIGLVVDLLPKGEEMLRIACVEAKLIEIAGVALPQMVIGGAASSVERAYAVIEELDRRSHSHLNTIANFA
jgi:HPr kinase/phosphorylase